MKSTKRLDHDTEEAVRRFLLLISRRYKISAVIVYGSRAQGTHHPTSDADVAVILKGAHQNLKLTSLKKIIN